MGSQPRFVSRLLNPETLYRLFALGQHPQAVFPVYAHGQYPSERSYGRGQLAEGLGLFVEMIDAAIVFQGKESVRGTFDHEVIVFEVGKMQAGLLPGIEPVEPVIGLYPKHILSRAANSVYQVARNQVGRLAVGGIEMHVRAVKHVQPVARAYPNQSPLVLVQRKDGTVGQSVPVG